jgi:PAS domain S-box-containing protein
MSEILRAQGALRESEERLRVAAEVGRMYAWEWDPATDSVRRSAEYASILGDDGWSPEGVATDYFTFIHPEDGPRLLSVVRALTPDAPNYRMQYRRTRTDGALLWLEESGHATFGRAGKMVRLVGMTADITESKQAEEKLQASEEFSRQIVQKSPVAMLVVSGGLEQQAVTMNDKFTALFGYTIEDIADVEDWWPLAYPDELYRAAIREDWQARVAEAIRSQSEIEPMEARVRCKNGAYRYIQFYFAPLGSASLVTFIDLTDQKNAELALANLGRRLIEAQEEERTRIGQELHDDLCFELAILGHGMDGLVDMLAGSGADVRERAAKLRKRVAEILMGAATLSHELHSPKIELLGLGGAVQSLCDEIAGTHHITVDFVAEDLPTSLPKDISICLFRVAQEALRNSVKHSGADRVRVELSGENGAIQLSVCDAGVGFDPATAINGPGIGLISMRERINLVKGTMAIHSKPSGGTEILCSVPVSGPVGNVPSQ